MIKLARLVISADIQLCLNAPGLNRPNMKPSISVAMIMKTKRCPSIGFGTIIIRPMPARKDRMFIAAPAFKHVRNSPHRKSCKTATSMTTIKAKTINKATTVKSVNKNGSGFAEKSDKIENIGLSSTIFIAKCH